MYYIYKPIVRRQEPTMTFLFFFLDKKKREKNEYIFD